MSDLDSLRPRGWSYYAGWNQCYRRFIARAWKNRQRPLKTPNGVTLFKHCLSACGATIDEAAQRCAFLVRERENGVEHHHTA